MIRPDYYLILLKDVGHEGERRSISVRRSVEIATDLCVSYRVALSFVDYHVFLRYIIISQHRRHEEKSKINCFSLGFVFDLTERKKEAF